jgi:uncharacterized protein (TIGR03435 family)
MVRRRSRRSVRPTGIEQNRFLRLVQSRLEFAPVAPDREPESARPSIFSALEQQLGIKVESQKGTEDVLLIDHVERPSAN